MERIEETERKAPEFLVNAAVLHIFDYSSGVSCFSEETLNLEDAVIGKYVSGHIRRAFHDLRNRRGYFRESSEFLKWISIYAEKRIPFLAFSSHAAAAFDAFLKDLAVYSCDVLFADFRYEDVPYIAMLILENQQAWTHSTENHSGRAANTIVQHHAILPSASKKLNTFAFVNLLTMEVRYTDETKWNTGDIAVMQDLILDCTSERSDQEMLETVTEIAGEIASEFDENPTLLLPKVKQIIRRSAENDGQLDVSAAAEEIFEDVPEMKAAFLKRTEENEIPQQIEIPARSSSRRMKNQRIRTDTGIELSFPVEYTEHPDLIEFINEPDGTISISIRGIGRITPRK